MELVRTVVGRLLLFVVLAVVIIALFGYFLVRRSFPDIDGSVEVVGIDAEVEVLRDVNGVPHLFANSTNDLYFAQGFVHAQDRFWQMDFWRHIGAGETMELFGSSQREADEFLRTLGFTRIAQEELGMLQAETQAILDAYAAGVNAYLDEHQGSALSFEYTLLGLTNRGYEPEPWTPIHSLTWAKVMAWDLANQNMRNEIDRAVLARALPDRIDELYPSYPSTNPIITPGGGTSAGTKSGIAAFIPPATLEALSAHASVLDELTGPSTRDIGSNSWVVSGDLTATGLPILANDPHLGIQMPSIWYEIGLHCSCPYSAAGFSFAGVPGVVIGHNERIAWGLTNEAMDSMDLFVERINPDNPDQYEVQGQWVDMETRTEILEVAGDDAVTVEVRTTSHGPIISEVFEPLEDLDERTDLALPEQYAVALSWTALQPSTVFDAFLGINRATSWEEFREALRHFDIGAQNVVYADVDGNIGYHATGDVPIRTAGDGRRPVPGWTGSFDWRSTVDFDAMPALINPPEGFIVTANNPVIGDAYQFQLSDDWDYGYRAKRIIDLLTSVEAVTLEDMRAFQGDTYNELAPRLVGLISELRPAGNDARQAQAVLAEWVNSDDAFEMSSTGAAPAIYQAFWRNLLARTFHDELPEEVHPGGSSRWFAVVSNLLGTPTNAFWDDARTRTEETRDVILLAAFEDAIAELTQTLGANVRGWSWGALHTAEFENQSFGSSGIGPVELLFNRGPIAVGGGSSIVNATAWFAPDGYEVIAVPSMRMILDLSDWDKSLAMHTTGQSGHIYSPHYDDMIERWSANEQAPLWWTKNAVELNVEGILTLEPGQS